MSVSPVIQFQYTNTSYPERNQEKRESRNTLVYLHLVDMDMRLR